MAGHCLVGRELWTIDHTVQIVKAFLVRHGAFIGT